MRHRVKMLETCNRKLLWRAMLQPKRPEPAQPSVVWQMLVRMWGRIWQA
jgi:hypothetical protein